MMAPTIAVSIDELHKMQTEAEVLSWRAIARAFYGAQFWIEEQAMRHLERLSTTGDLHADKMQTAHEAADAEFDTILAEYRNSDAKAAHDRQEAAGLAMLALMGEEFLNDYLHGEVDCDRTR